MKRSTKYLMAVALTALLNACAASPQPTRVATAEDGARIWRATCSRCHNARPASEFDARQWPVIVNHMRTHAALTRTQAASIAAFLSASAASDGAGPHHDSHMMDRQGRRR